MTLDTNVLVRSVVRDDPAQAALADALLRSATVIAIPLSCLCEFVWVLRRAYRLRVSDITHLLRVLLAVQTVAVDRPAVEAGLATLDAGGDFADGVIAHEGLWLGGQTFASFDRKAVSLLQAHGRSATLLA